MTPFDHLKNLHTKKRNWDEFNDEEKKNFNIFIINKALSFNPNYLNVVNSGYVFSHHSTALLSSSEKLNSLIVYNFLLYY